MVKATSGRAKLPSKEPPPASPDFPPQCVPKIEKKLKKKKNLNVCGVQKYFLQCFTFLRIAILPSLNFHKCVF